MGTSSSLLHSSMLCLFFFFVFVFFMDVATYVQGANVTDSVEVAALNTILQRWGKRSSSSWNNSGDGNPCTGAALDVTQFYLPENNPMITCDCDSFSVCHIIRLRVYALDVTGSIPQELQNFTHLKILDLDQNYLTGRVPTFFGNFTEAEELHFGFNALSGPIPKEIGSLKKLKLLGISVNNLSGTIPPEFGGLTSLERWYMDSCGLSGELPSQLSNLKSLQLLIASDNNFTGKLPDFIGSLTNLTELRLQGNSFQGPIPASFSNLTKLTNLLIGDLIDGSSTLQFVSGMSSLSALILRNCKISGALPSDFSQYTKLQILDLSFNNITGSIPQSIFVLSNLLFLFLGNNSLSGSLPTQKSSSLTSVDVSYNQLTGSFPPWASESNLQLNLVANNFVIDDSNNKSSLPSGLKCLQNDKPCFRNSPVYSSFAVKCGGSRTITASDKVQYDIDDANVSSASYYVTDPIRWGVSSVGNFFNSKNSTTYKLSSLYQFQNTLDSELFQTARISPSSLRYYGLGLENGNYTIKLQFAEMLFTDRQSWISLGRRIFDIYIQGDLKEKDFDIRKEAGGVSLTAVAKKYTVPVTDNFLEIHFFWAGKGTCCIPFQSYYGPSISAISISPDFTPTVRNKPPGSSSDHTALKLAVGLGVGAAVVALGLLLLLILIQIRRKRILKEEYEQDGRTVAVKQLSLTSHQGKNQFLTEIATISSVQHRNLVKLHGCCIEGDKRILVYEYLENKSIDQAIFGKNKLHIDWPQRFEICLGVARGLAYLHEESSVRIVHRDVKASNVLLDADLNPKISDFGLAKLYDDKKTHISTKVAGTIGYLAPEYAMRGHLTEKVDVYAFGVLSLEILAGRLNSVESLERDKIYLLEWVWHLRENGRELEMVDERLSYYNKDEALRVIGVALLCTQASPAQRPPMSRVVAMLTGDIEVSQVMAKPSYLIDYQYHMDSATSSYVTDNSVLAGKGTDSSSTPAQTIMSSPSAVDSLINSFVDEGR